MKMMSSMGGWKIFIFNRIFFSDLVPGSPADRADLEVGDEIVEVNGVNMEGCSHGEIISHIHKVRSAV